MKEKVATHVIDVQLVHKIGIIGYKNHANRIISILEKFSNFEIIKIYHPNKKIDDIRGTNNFGELYSCDCVFILSPNQTHFEYIFKLINNFGGYIFCEKPPVTTQLEIEKLEKISDQKKNKIFFNFNFRFSKLNEILEEFILKEKLGKIIHINIIGTHGLAFKKEYLDSWRADGKKNLDNVLDTLAIHYLDLIILHFKNINDSQYYPMNSSQNGTSYDSCNLSLKSGKVITSIFCSYASAKINEIIIIGTNGYLTIRDNIKMIFYPRNTFDSKGFFTNPPKIHEEKFDFENEYELSLERSIEYFLECVKAKKLIKLDYFNTSMKTTKMLINLKRK